MIKNVFLIGHRGVGKSSILKKMGGLGFDLFSLDDEIEKKEGAIQEIFSTFGEESFRKIEIETLNQVLGSNKNKKIIDLGAGCSLSNIKFPESSVVVWLYKSSDRKGRIFFDRPDIVPVRTFEDDWLKKFSEREKKYESFANLKILLDEVNFDPQVLFLRKFLKAENFDRGGFVTLNSFKDYDFLGKIFTKIELRTDLLRRADLEYVLAEKRDQCLVSQRTDIDVSFVKNYGALLDVDFKYPDNYRKADFISVHQDRISFEPVKVLLDEGYKVKWAPVVQSFAELILGHNEFKKYSGQLSFLPRTSDEDLIAYAEPRWQWYRRQTSSEQFIHFERFDEGSSLDQPILADNRKSFFAILGSPVSHSKTPNFHISYFGQKGTAVPMLKSDLTKDNLLFLARLGIKFFAVTSPLKEIAGNICAQDYVNTLYVNDEQIFGFFTDPRGVDFYIKKYSLDSERVLIFGSGAMGKLFSKALDGALIVPARRGDLSDVDMKKFDTLIWAAGSNKFPETSVFGFQKVIDLDYTLYSKARLFAKKNKLDYISGEDFFQTQGLAQQSWWSKFQ